MSSGGAVSWGNVSVSTGETGDEVCAGSGCAITSGYWAVGVRAGSWEAVIGFPMMEIRPWAIQGLQGERQGCQRQREEDHPF